MCVGAAVGAANTLTALGTVVSMAATNQQAKGVSEAYNSQADANEVNSWIAQQQAKDAIERGQVEEDRSRQKAEKFKASQKAALAGNGMDVTSGTGLDLLTDTEYLSEVDAALIRYNAGQEAQGFRRQANNYIFQARGDRAAASNARTAGRIAMGTTLIGGATTIADRFNKYKP